MNTKQIKKTLIDRDLTITQMAHDLAKEYPANAVSIRQMISDMIYQRRWYPTLAKKIADAYGINFIRPAHFEPKVRLKRAA